MLRNFFTQPNALRRLVLVLLLAGGVVFAGAFNRFVVQTQASNCCSSGTCVHTTLQASNCCGSGTCVHTTP